MNKLLVVLLTLLSICFVILGNDIGLPSSKMYSIIFTSKEELLSVTNVLVQLREEVYTQYKQDERSELFKYYAVPDETVNIIISGRSLCVKKEYLHNLRGFMLQSRLPDEQHLIKALTKINPRKLQFNPYLYQYGTVYIYTVGVSLKLAEILGFVKISNDVEYYMLNPDDTKKLYTTIRITGGLIGCLSIPAIYLCGTAFFGAPVGIISAIFLSLIPVIMIESHTTKPYAFFLPFFIIALYYSKKISENKDLNKNCILAAVSAAFSTGSLVTTGFVIFAPIVSLILANNKKQILFSKLLLIITVFAATFLITNPYWIFSTGEVLKELVFLKTVNPFHLSIGNVLHHLFFEYYKEFGIFTYVFLLLGLILSVSKFSNEDKILLVVFLPSYLYMCGYFWDRTHYDIITVPIMILLGARFIFYLYTIIKFNSKIRIIYLGALLITAIYTLSMSLYYLNIFVRFNNHLLDISEWIKENIAYHSSIGVSGQLNGIERYPPINTLRYIFSDKKPEYYIAINKKDPVFLKSGIYDEYEVIKTFELDKTFLNKIYSNERLAIFDNTTYILKRKGTGYNVNK